MLPKEMHALRERLRRVTNLSAEQGALLAELDAFDRSRHTEAAIAEERLEKGAARIVSGPGGRCSCCGR